MWRIRRAPNSIPIYSYIQQDATLHSLFISGNCSCWICKYIGILLGARPILHISKIKVNTIKSENIGPCADFVLNGCIMNEVFPL
jgi:hypothetical protein